MSLVAVAVGALLLPAIALAARSVIHGPAGGGSGTVDITLFTNKSGKVTKLTRFEFNNIQTSCGGRTSATSGTFPHTIKVSSKGKFHATVKQNGGRNTYTVHGHFSDPKHAAGTLRITGPVPGCGADGDTGKVHWSAKHN